jgi:hypothetical protein
MKKNKPVIVPPTAARTLEEMEFPESLPGPEFNPPIEYLLSCSPRGLRDYEIAALNRRAGARRELKDVVLDTLARAEADVMLANWFVLHRDELLRAATRSARKVLPPAALDLAKGGDTTRARELLADLMSVLPEVEDHAKPKNS